MLVPGKNRIGTTLRLAMEFRDSTTGALLTPDSLTLQTYSPEGRTTTYTNGVDANIGAESVGVYYCEITPNEAGRWYIRWLATTGDGTLAIEDNFTVQTSSFFNTYAGDYT